MRHYYTGTEVRPADHPKKIRVGIGQARSAINFRSSPAAAGGGRLVLKVDGKSTPVASGGPGAEWRVEPTSAGKVRIFKNGNVVQVDGHDAFGGPHRPVIVQYEKYDSLLYIVEQGNHYRYGRLVVQPYAAPCSPGYCLRMMSHLPMQEYLYGVSEVSPTWPKEALRVQAILSRTYVTYSVDRYGQHRPTCNCAVYDTSLDQVFVGDDRRTESGTYWSRWKRAVNRSDGEIVLYNGQPILAVYTSSSGGHTENNENVWGGSPIPYLRGVKDAADGVAANVRHSWKVKMSWSTFSSKLNAAYGTGKLIRFRIKQPLGVSGRVTVVKSPDRGGVKIVGSARTVRVSGWSVKSALGLYDTLFSVRFVS